MRQSITDTLKHPAVSITLVVVVGGGLIFAATRISEQRMREAAEANKGKYHEHESDRLTVGGGNPFDRNKFDPSSVLGQMPAITSFDVKTVAEIGDNLDDDELVIGVVVGGKARAYPINMLTGPEREILNDTLGGQAIAATW